jgi:hypothetical protein
MAIAKTQMTGLTGAMYEDMNNSSITISNTGAVSGSAIGTITTTAATSTVSMRPNVDEVVDRYALNEFVVEHRIQEFELMKLRESNVDYADVIKNNLAKMASRDIIKKMTFTKKHEINSDTHSFRGRVWVFTKDELTQMIQEIKNGI